AFTSTGMWRRACISYRMRRPSVVTGLFVAMTAAAPGAGLIYAQNTPPVPAAYQDLYGSLSTQLNAFESVVHAGGTYPTAFSGQLQSANSANGAALLTSPYSTVLMELDSMKALGVKAVNVGIHFPILYSPYYANVADY